MSAAVALCNANQDLLCTTAVDLSTTYFDCFWRYLVPLMLVSVMLDKAHHKENASSLRPVKQMQQENPPRLSLKKVMNDAVKRRVDSCTPTPTTPTTSPSNPLKMRIKRKPLVEKDTNVVAVEGDVESMDEKQVAELLFKLRTTKVVGSKGDKRCARKAVPSVRDVAQVTVKEVEPSSKDSHLLIHALSRPAPPIPTSSAPTPPSSPTDSPIIRERPPSKYDSTLPTVPSRFSIYRPRPASSSSPNTRIPATSKFRTPHNRTTPHHGHTKSSLAVTRSLWEDRYESWLYNKLEFKCHIRTKTSSSLSTPPELNPALFPRIGDLKDLHPTSHSSSSTTSMELDWYFGTCTLSSIQRTLFIFDMEHRASRSTGAAQEEKMDRPWERSWELRWQILAAIYRHNMGVAVGDQPVSSEQFEDAERVGEYEEDLMEGTEGDVEFVNVNL